MAGLQRAEEMHELCICFFAGNATFATSDEAAPLAALAPVWRARARTHPSGPEVDLGEGWSGSGPPSATCAPRIREATGAERPLIVKQGKRYRARPGVFDVDVWHFQAALIDSRQASSRRTKDPTTKPWKRRSSGPPVPTGASCLRAASTSGPRLQGGAARPCP